MLDFEDFAKYPEYPLDYRTKLTYDFIPENTNTLLDCGCAFGFGTRFFKNKCKKTFGLDVYEKYVNIAKHRYPTINFLTAGVENLPFKSESFNVIIFSQVLEHIEKDVDALNGLWRILKKNGVLILQVPNKGLFSFMDTDNIVYFMRKKLPFLLKFIYKLIRKPFPKINPGYENRHKHYTLKNILKLTDSSDLKGHYKVEKVFRSGLFFCHLDNILDIFTRALFKKKLMHILKPFKPFTSFEFWLPFGPFSYNLALKIIKT